MNNGDIIGIVNNSNSLTIDSSNNEISINENIVAIFENFTADLINITFLVGASPASATAILRNVYFANTLFNITTDNREFIIIGDDGATMNHRSIPFYYTLEVETINYPPIITFTPLANPNYVAGGAPIFLYAMATVTDTDNSNYEGSILSMDYVLGTGFVGQQGTDYIEYDLSGTNFTAFSKSVNYNGDVFGNVNSDGTTGKALTLSLSSISSPEIVSLFLRTISFRTDSGAITGLRQINITLDNSLGVYGTGVLVTSVSSSLPLAAIIGGAIGAAVFLGLLTTAIVLLVKRKPKETQTSKEVELDKIYRY